jgi:ABC-type nickel/cobalt efflux system permease component RcnA
VDTDAAELLYGVLHAAGPGHGKAVVSAWLLANERQLRRGVLISFMAAAVQAMTAIVLVTGLLLSVKAAAKTAKSMAIGLEAASFGLIALTGLWLVWQAVRPRLAPAPALAHAGSQVATAMIIIITIIMIITATIIIITTMIIMSTATIVAADTPTCRLQPN